LEGGDTIAKLYGSKKTGQIIAAADLRGLSEKLRKIQGFVKIIDNYKGYFYTIWVRFNEEKGEYEFTKTSKTNAKIEKLLEDEGYRKIKEPFTNDINTKDYLGEENLN
jgi:hypothetical protein